MGRHGCIDSRVPTGENKFIGEDLNGHFGKDSGDLREFMETKGMEQGMS